MVAEISIIPSEVVENMDLIVTVRGIRGSYDTSNTSLIHVGEVIENGGNGERDPLGELAIETQEKFIMWLSENHPELRITSEVEWTGVNIRPNLHVMVPPYDWSRIYLRSRFTETVPTLAYELSSYTMDEYEIRSVDLEEAFAETIWR